MNLDLVFLYVDDNLYHANRAKLLGEIGYAS